MPERTPMVLLTSITGSFPARVLEARLHSEGIDAHLRGAVDGPYPFSVGGWAEVGVFVPADQLDDARLVLLADEVDAAFERPRAQRSWTRGDMAVVLVLLCSLVVVGVARAFGVF